MERAAVVFAMITQSFPERERWLIWTSRCVRQLRVLDDYVTRLKLKPKLRFTTGLHCVEDARPQAMEFHDYNIGFYRYHLVSQTTLVGESPVSHQGSHQRSNSAGLSVQHLVQYSRASERGRGLDKDA